jgi:hypothetical protein
MEKLKKILTWETHNDNNNGRFKCRLKNPTKMSQLISGTKQDGTPYSFHAYITQTVRGEIVWVDYIKSDFGNKLRVVLKEENGINQIDFDYDSKNLSSIIGAFLTLGKELLGSRLEFNYIILTKDKSGKPILSKAGKPSSKRYVLIGVDGQNVKPYYNVDNPKPKAIEWVKNAKGDWDDSKEIIFWTTKIVAIQESLLKKKVAFPLSYNSLTYTSVESEFYKVVDSQLRETGNDLYKAQRNQYEYVNQSSSSKKSSSDFFSDEEDEIFGNQTQSEDRPKSNFELLTEDSPFNEKEKVEITDDPFDDENPMDLGLPF